MSTATISVEIVKKEREARAKAEAEVANLKEQLEFQALVASEAQAAVNTLSKDRDVVKQRVEKMLQQMDELL